MIFTLSTGARIETERLGRGWRAHLAENRRVWEFGQTETEAIGKLVVSLVPTLPQLRAVVPPPRAATPPHATCG